MIKYTVKPGDSLSVLSVKYETTVRILMKDNPSIPFSQRIYPGETLFIFTPEENAKRFCKTANQFIEKAHATQKRIKDTKYLTKKPREPIYFNERLTLEGQEGFLRTTDELPLIELKENGFQKHVREVRPGEIFHVFDMAKIDNQWHFLVDDYLWIPAIPDKTIYEEITQEDLDGKIRINQQESRPVNPRAMTISTFATNPMDQQLMAAEIPVKNKADYGKKTRLGGKKIQPKSLLGSGKPLKGGDGFDGITSIPHFERRFFKRPIMNLKNAAGESKRIELRTTGFSIKYGNNANPMPTNSGWMINVGPSDLPQITIRGFLLETKANDEIGDFMSRYKKYLQASRDQDYYSMGISTLYYKETEYKGVVLGFNVNEQSEQPLHRKYTLQMLVLDEKDLSGKQVRNLKTVVSRRGQSEEAFRSDLGSMLANPITGKYNKDF